jgi:hypothetical protein
VGGTKHCGRLENVGLNATLDTVAVEMVSVWNINKFCFGPTIKNLASANKLTADTQHLPSIP